MSILETNNDRQEELIKSDQYKQVYYLLSEIFQLHDYDENDTFGNDVFFLTNLTNNNNNNTNINNFNTNLNNLINIKNIKSEFNIFYILSSLNENNLKNNNGNNTNNNTNSSKNLSNLNESGYSNPFELCVKVGKFISLLTETIIKSKIILEKIKEHIKENNSIEKQTKIDLLIKKLKNNAKNKFYPNKTGVSKLSISLQKLNFPIGNFSFNLNFTELAVYNNENLQYKKCKKSLISKKAITIQEEFYNGFYVDKILKDHPEEYTFEKIIFMEKEVNIPGDFSGTTLLDFQIEVFRNDLFYGETSKELFVDILLIYTDEIMDTSSSTIGTSYKIPIYLKENEISSNKMIGNYNSVMNNTNNNSNHNFNISGLLQNDIHLNLHMDLDIKTRIAMLKRIETIFANNISTKIFHESFINEIFDKYFSTIKAQAERIILTAYKCAEDEEELSRVEEKGCCDHCRPGCMVY